MATSNEILFDELLKGHTLFQKAAFKEAKNNVAWLSTSDAKDRAWLKNRLQGLIQQGEASDEEIGTLLGELGTRRARSIDHAVQTATKKMSDATRAGIKQTLGSMQKALKGLPIASQLGLPAADAVAKQSALAPFGGFDVMHQISEWGVNMMEADRHAIEGAIKSGIANGKTTPQIMKTVEQVQGVTKQNAEAITKTALNHAANTGRNAVFEENSDIISVLRWLSTLDGRTSPICRSLDGKVRPLGEDGNIPDGMEALPKGGPQQPPAHLRCRSLMIAILDGEDIADQLGDRPTVTDKRTGKQRQLDFEKDARARYNQDRGPQDPPWSKLDASEKSPYRKGVRKEWADKNVGSAPGDTTYDQWLRKQDDGFQNQVLGKQKAEMYRDDPNMTMDKMIDSDGRPLTIKELEDGVDVDLDTTRPESPAAAERRNAQAKKATADQNERIRKRLEAADEKAAKKVADAEAKAKRDVERAEAKAARAEKADAAAQKKADRVERRRVAAEKRAAAAKERARVREEARVAREQRKLAKAEADLAEARKPKPGQFETIEARHDRLMEEFGPEYKKLTPAEKARFQEHAKLHKQNHARDAGTRHQDTLMMSDAEARANGFDNRHLRHPENIPDPDGILDGVDIRRAGRDGQYAWDLDDKQLDHMWGQERREVFRNRASLDQIIDAEGFPRNLETMVVEMPEHMRRPGMSWSRSQQQAMADDLGASTHQALEDWGANHGQYVRYQVDPTDISRPEIPGRVVDIEDLLENGVQYDGTVYRGLGLNNEDLADLLDTGEFTNRSFSSSTIDPGQAHWFARGSREPNDVVIEIIGGHRGVQVMDFTSGINGDALKTEMEVLLAKDTKYRVLRHRILKNGQHVFQMEEI